MAIPKSERTSAGGAEPAAPQPIHRVLVFCIVGASLLMMSVDSTIVATALHALQNGLDTSINWAGWTLTAYSLGVVVLLPVSGKLSEWYGHRRVFFASVIVFTVASLLCGFASDIGTLIVLRVIQAAGGAGFTPAGTAIIVRHFGESRDRAVALFGTIFPIGAMIGPVIGGVLVAHWSWRAVFLVNVPVGIAIALLVRRYVPRDPPQHGGKPSIDWIGMTLMGAGILGCMLAINRLGDPGVRLSDAPFWALAVVGVGALAGFFRHVNHAREPFIASFLMVGRGFGAVNAVNFIYGGITMAAVALLPLYATNRYGIGVLASGTLLTAQGVAGITMSIAGTLALRRTGYRLPLYVGGALIAVGTALFAIEPRGGATPYLWLAAAAFGVGIGTGTISPPSRNAGLQLAPEHASTLAALRTLCFQSGAILGISVVTAILASSADPGLTQAWVYAGIAALFFLALPLVARVPEHRGSW